MNDQAATMPPSVTGCADDPELEAKREGEPAYEPGRAYPTMVLLVARSIGEKVPDGQRIILSIYDLGRLDGVDHERAEAMKAKI